MTIEADNPFLLWVKLVSLSTSRIIIVEVRDPLLSKAVPVNHGECGDIVSNTSNVQVIFLSKEHNLIIEVSVICLDLVALNKVDPLTSELSDNTRQVSDLLLKGNSWISFPVNSLGHLDVVGIDYLSGTTIVKGKLWVLLNVSLHPLDLTMMPLVICQFVIDVVHGFAEDFVEVLTVFRAVVEADDVELRVVQVVRRQLSSHHFFDLCLGNSGQSKGHLR